ncbi:MAG: dienelactone hydrolase family protein [Betaproteobacteria bacterium]|nr:dienelactone hydrolase family protein [Betaproteobacteria bacterium]
MTARVRIAGSAGFLEGELALPLQPAGVVLFAHGSGSSRHSPRNLAVAAQLREAGLGTLLVDLLSAQEDQRDESRFDIDLLTRRLAEAAGWLNTDPRTAGLPLGLFGASTGAAAALRLAASAPGAVTAVVSRGGRPDLADRAALRAVRAPVLLVVGGNDDIVLAINREALAELRCPKRLSIVPRATHLFPEPGALAQVGRLAADWFGRWFEATPAEASGRAAGVQPP